MISNKPYFPHTVKSHVEDLDLYNFIRGSRWAYKREDLYPWGIYKQNKKLVSEWRDKMYLRNKLKRTYHYIYDTQHLYYIYDTEHLLHFVS